MKRLIAMCLFLALALSGCGTAGTPSAPPESSAQPPSTAPTQTQTPVSTPAGPSEAPTQSGKALVVYYSATGSTQKVAGYIAEALGADQLELVPVEPYSSADLSWTTDGSRVNREHDDETLRDVELEADTVENWSDYDTIFVGYPIWWGIAAWPVNDFIKSNDFTGKTVIPFCTSASSGLGESGELLAEMAGTGDWQEGMRFRSGVSQEDVTVWIEDLGLTAYTPVSETSGILVAYFSIPEDVDPAGADAVSGASIVVRDGEVLGNTQYVAQLIQETVGGDLFRIETVQQYPLDHDPLVDQASDEKAAATRPELSTHIENLEQYDTILLGYPNWWADLPMPLYTFLEEYDLSSKTIIPFVTHGGSRASRTVDTIAQLQPNATVWNDPLVLSRNDVASSADQVIIWAEGLNLNK